MFFSVKMSLLLTNCVNNNIKTSFLFRYTDFNVMASRNFYSSGGRMAGSVAARKNASFSGEESLIGKAETQLFSLVVGGSLDDRNNNKTYLASDLWAFVAQPTKDQHARGACENGKPDCLEHFFKPAFDYFGAVTKDLYDTKTDPKRKGQAVSLHSGLHFWGEQGGSNAARCWIFHVTATEWNQAKYFTTAHIEEDEDIVVVIEGGDDLAVVIDNAEGIQHPAQRVLYVFPGEGPKVEILGSMKGAAVFAPERDVYLRVPALELKTFVVGRDVHFLPPTQPSTPTDNTHNNNNEASQRKCSHTPGRDACPDTLLYVWAGDATHTHPDFLAVVNFDSTSPNYGTVISTVPLPPPGNFGNEPHHCSINVDSNVLMCTGLLSLLSGQNGIFIFDISDRRHPRFLFSTSTVLSSIADDVLPLPNGGFLVTMMGSAAGGSPGRIAEFDRCMRLVAEHPSNPPNGFNPHGIHMRTDINVVVSSDFLVPATSLIGFPGGLALSSTVRFFDYPSFDQLAVVSLPVAPTLNGTLDVKFILGDSDARAVTSNTFSGQLWTVDPNSNTATLAFDCNSVVASCFVQQLVVTASGDRLLATVTGGVLMVDISDPTSFSNVAYTTVSGGASADTHYLRLTNDQARLVVTDYFLNEGPGGKIDLDGDHIVHVFKVTENSLTVDSSFSLDFDTAFSFSARPHGVAMI